MGDFPVTCEHSLVCAPADGLPLSWNDIVANLPQAYQQAAKQPDAMWTFLSQTDHPHLNLPWYMLHPCQTAELMDLMLNSAEAETAAQGTQDTDFALLYMTAWFSLVGPVFNLQSACAPVSC